MSLQSEFLEYCTSIELDSSEMMKTVGEIAKKLNKEYYELEGETEEHMYVVGSVGRLTAIKGASDLDLLFALPQEIYDRYDAYETNGQSALLQDIKGVLQERYKKTDLRADGQVVVIDFTNYTVELVPAFEKNDGSFLYPDTHEGGSWKITNPILEQKECNNSNEKSDGKYYNFCHIIRAWKNQGGFEFSGLLIDTLIDKHMQDADYYNDSDKSYFGILLSILRYLGNCNSEQKYWLAIGSNQRISDKGSGTFVKKAKRAYKELIDSIEDKNTNEVLANLLGNSFPHTTKTESKAYRDTEEFIENQYPVDIRYRASIDCKITQDGFRPFLLSSWLIKGGWLKHNKRLEFFLEDTNCPEPFDICWKVRNVGRVAEERDQIRGQICNTGKRTQIEHTNFFGPHYVECYIIKNGICVAKARIDVPIEK